MNMFNRFIMRRSGERKFQPQTEIEAIVFGIFDFLGTKKSLPPDWEQKNEVEKNEYMEKLGEHIDRSISGFRPAFVETSEKTYYSPVGIAVVFFVFGLMVATGLSFL